MLLDEWRYSDNVFKVAKLLFWTNLVIITLSFATPYWLVSVPSERVPDPKFTNLGLWVVCLNGYHDMRHQYDTRFYGCKHILLEDYDIIRSELQPPFMIATQFFYTLCYCGLLIALLFLLMYLFCINDYYRVSVLRWIGIDLIMSGCIGSIALIIFGAKADGRDFMPEWEHNYHGWSFGVGVLGAILLLFNGVLFLVEARILDRKERAREKQFPQERTV